MKIPIFNTRSVVAAAITGVGVTAAIVVLAGDLWALAPPAGLAASALALITPLQFRDARFVSRGGRRGRIVLLLASLIVLLLGQATASYIGLERSTGWLLAMVIWGTGGAVYTLGFIAGALHQIEDDDEAREHVALSLRG